uniref:Uncharacterized protein n=1 Tax=Cacopsylla melanoneura TaxID=428564 RepID=A0A8D9DYW3_9HEMI
MRFELRISSILGTIINHCTLHLYENRKNCCYKCVAMNVYSRFWLQHYIRCCQTQLLSDYQIHQAAFMKQKVYFTPIYSFLYNDGPYEPLEMTNYRGLTT